MKMKSNEYYYQEYYFIKILYKGYISYVGFMVSHNIRNDIHDCVLGELINFVNHVLLSSFMPVV